MFELWGATHVTNAYADLSLRSTAGWQQVHDEIADLDMTFVLLGDEACGPAIVFVADAPSERPEYREALARHLSASGAIFYGAYW